MRTYQLELLALGELPSRWIAESSRIDVEAEDFDTVDCAELPPELDLYRVMAETDEERFIEAWVKWDAFICEQEIWLPLEQSSYEGVLLPTDQRIVRLATCPERMLRPLRRFFESCPPHAKHYLALRYYWLVRIDRARRIGSPSWRPESGPPMDSGWWLTPR